MNSSKRKKTQKKKELTNLGAALRALGGLGGASVGALIGYPTAGTAYGTSLGAALSKWLGSGDYTIGSNSIVTRLKSSDSVPMMHKDDQTIIVRHREYLGEIKSSTAFSTTYSFPINPGLAVSFPWLSDIAVRFQEYRVRGMVYHYIPTSGDAVSSTSPSLGSVMISTTYRASDSAPTSKLEMLNEYTTNESVPSESFCHPVECNPKENPFNVQYVRNGPPPSGDSLMMYDLGTTTVAVSGQQANGNSLGDLWVTYEIELKKPLFSSNTTSTSPTFAGSYSNPTGSTWFFAPSVTSGSLAMTTSGRTLTFPAGSVGTYSLSTFWNGTNISAVSGASDPTLTNCTLAAPYLGWPVGSVTAAVNATGAYWYYNVAVTITDPTQPAVVVFPNITITASTLVNMRLNVMGGLYS